MAYKYSMVFSTSIEFDLDSSGLSRCRSLPEIYTTHSLPKSRGMLSFSARQHLLHNQPLLPSLRHTGLILYSPLVRCLVNLKPHFQRTNVMLNARVPGGFGIAWPQLVTTEPGRGDEWFRNVHKFCFLHYIKQSEETLMSIFFDDCPRVQIHLDFLLYS